MIDTDPAVNVDDQYWLCHQAIIGYCITLLLDRFFGEGEGGGGFVGYF